MLPSVPDVDDDFADVSRFVGGFFRGGDRDIHVTFETSELPGDDEENEEQENDVDHGGELQLGSLLSIGISEFHFESVCLSLFPVVSFAACTGAIVGSLVLGRQAEAMMWVMAASSSGDKFLHFAAEDGVENQGRD
jgi:hypothetical protein